MKQLLLAATVALVRLVEIELARTAIRRSALIVLLGFCVGMAGLGVVICLLTALWMYEVPLLGPINATLLIAGVLLLATVMLLLAMRHFAQPTAPIVQNAAYAPPATPDFADLAAAAAAAFITGLLRKPKT